MAAAARALVPFKSGGGETSYTRNNMLMKNGRGGSACIMFKAARCGASLNLNTQNLNATLRPKSCHVSAWGLSVGGLTLGLRLRFPKLKKLQGKPTVG